MSRDRDLFTHFERMRREMDSFFGDVLERSGVAARGQASFSPPIDIYYTGQPAQAVIIAAVAGVEVGDIELKVAPNEITLKGVRKCDEPEGRDYQQIEMSSGQFERTIHLDLEVVPSEAQATYQNGLLKVEIPLRKRNGRRGTAVVIEII